MRADAKTLDLCAQQRASKLERLAGWVGTTLAAAFFASLERCSCVTLNTTDAKEDEEANDKPLVSVNMKDE